MPTPFPGMDPYLEGSGFWPAFHHELIECLHALIVPGLLDGYQRGIGERRYAADSGINVIEEYIEIRERRGKLVTLLEVVSPLNKTSATGRTAYLDTRRAAKDAGSSLVEIDLVKQGQRMLDYSRQGLPEWDYAVTVERSTSRERYEIYTATLDKRLPRFRLPLAPDDRDTVVDLLAAFRQAFERGKFAGSIDYCREPEIPLTTEQRRWLHDWLKWPTLSHDEIAAAAYQVWQEAGCPHGHDQEHWQLAIERLRRAKAQGG